MTTTTGEHDTSKDSLSIRWDDFRTLWDRTGSARSRTARTRTDLAAAALWLGALFTVFVTWNGAAGKASLGEQVPYLLSGGLATVAMALGGSVVFLVGVLGDARTGLDDGPPGGNDGGDR